MSYPEIECRVGGDDPEVTDPSWCVVHDSKWPGGWDRCMAANVEEERDALQSLAGRL